MKAFLATTLLLVLASCAGAPDPEAFALDLDGVRHTPLLPHGDAVHVVLFTSHECPIANGYAPTIQKLHAAWSAEPRVRLYLVHVDPDLTVDDARAHAADYGLPGTILLDPDHRLARACGATITPEVAVRTADGQMYRGRIDDQWRKLGSRAPKARCNDLRDAVRSILAGEPVPTPHPKAVGCLLPEPRNGHGPRARGHAALRN